uniref:Ribosome production factor 1 n=1 Tax=Petromyzon marinus TaxID=7757 RepID=A0AAJ7WKK6_PETMA|nr:ribosome production factor 1-like [Petromyzon marinus]
MIISHLPHGPTAHFKMSGVRLCSKRRKAPDTAPSSLANPELILNNFTTRIGLRVARQLAALHPHGPSFSARRVLTFHNQRDFIFFRHHRYIFRNERRVGLKELGPRLTLKLRSRQKGSFDSKFGDFEWVHKRHEMDSSRRKFHL